MAPTATGNASIPLQTGQAFAGDEFSNNLFSDLAPLLTLFGEQVTKQFLSMSMGWADDILLAMGPLGIMTVIVSAIRVGGVRVLKAFIGRARESRANAEKEILSSTSEDVCELWSGQEVIRELGNPEGMKDLILVGPEGLDDRSHWNLDSDLVSEMKPLSRYGGRKVAYRVLDINRAVTKEEVSRLSNGAPNIALNVRNATASPVELVLWAVISTVLQLSALVFPAICTYYWKWTKGNSTIASYGYPCFAAGTAMVVIGMILCGRVIEGSTTEHEFVPRDSSRSMQIMRLQKACTVSDQHFPSYAIFNSPEDLRIRTSRLNDKSYSKMAVIATLAAVLGFVTQFVGLRALHWSATIYQLGVMLILTVVRSLVRRGLAEDPVFYPLLDGHEAAWLVLYIVGNDQNGWANEKRKKSRKCGLGMRYFWKKSKVADPDLQDQKPHQRMLEPLIRWEPLAGYYNVDSWKIRTKEAIHNKRDSKASDEARTADDYASRAFTPLSKGLGAHEVAATEPSFQPLQICQQLQRLVPVSEEVLDAATSLAVALEGTMTLLTKTTSMRWQNNVDLFKWKKIGSRRYRTLSFGVKVLTGSYKPHDEARMQVVNFELLQREPEWIGYPDINEQGFASWAIDRESLVGVLQLWLFSLEIRKSAAKKMVTAANRFGKEHRPFQLLGRTSVYFRIVRLILDGKGKGIRSFDELDPWLSSSSRGLPFLGKSYADGMDQEMNRESGINTWVVWGQFLIPSSSDDIETASKSEIPFTAVPTRPETSLVAQCALEIFGCFMDAIASRVDEIGGITKGEEPVPNVPVPNCSNTLLQAIANECISARLAHDINEANTVIIPCFHKYDLLPKEPHDLKPWERKKSERNWLERVVTE